MTGKEEVIQRLQEYDWRKRALETIPQEIARLEAQFQGLQAAQTDGVQVQAQRDPEEKLVENIQRRRELEKRLQEHRQWCQVMDGAMEGLRPEYRRVLEAWYFRRKPMNSETVGDELGIDRSTAYRWRQNGISQLAWMLFGVDS
jgi:hypothetical protein